VADSSPPLPVVRSTVRKETSPMSIRGIALACCLFATPAMADGPSQISQVTAALAQAGGNVSIINQMGNNNIAETNQTGSLGMANVSQNGNNNISQIIQSGVGDVATNTQIGNGLQMKIVQTGPAQQITITQRR
jgi:hypothetical protein